VRRAQNLLSLVDVATGARAEQRARWGSPLIYMHYFVLLDVHRKYLFVWPPEISICLAVGCLEVPPFVPLRVFGSTRREQLNRATHGCIGF
jgi:hypothetical protein